MIPALKDRSSWLVYSPLAGLFAGGLINTAFLGSDDNHLWPVALGLAVSGLFCIGLGQYTRRQPAGLVRDPITGREFWARPRHSLLRLPAECWGIMYLVLGVLFFWALTHPH